MNRWEIEKQIAIKALKDPAFKKKLLSNPKEALKEHFKKEVHEDVLNKLNVKVFEEKKNEWTISIPYLETGGKKLSDTELEKLAAACQCVTLDCATITGS